MQKRKLILLIIVFCSLGFTNLYAQRALTVKEISGTSTSFYLTDVDKITFSDGNIIISKTGESPGIFALQDIGNLSFSGNPTSVQDQWLQDEVTFKLFPNPVRDHFIIGSNTYESSELIVEVINLQGKVLLNRVENSNNRIDVSDLRSGIYICRIHSLDKIENIKFIKH